MMIRMQVVGIDDLPSEVLCFAPSHDGTALFCGLSDGAVVLLGGPSASDAASAGFGRVRDGSGRLSGSDGL